MSAGAMADDIILKTSGLTKEFKGFAAVQDVNLNVRRGSIQALIERHDPFRKITS